MFSTRSCAMLLLAGMTLCIVGCQRVQPAPIARIDDSPLIVDEAMMLRDWERSTAWYPSGVVIASAHGRTFEVSDDVPESYRHVLDPAVATGNFILLPAHMLVSPPWKLKAYRGVYIPPTYTGQPPLE